MVVNTFAEMLFHRYYLCTIPACDYYDPRFIDKFGMHTHPDKNIAAAMLTDRIHEQMCPAMMASWVADGIDVRLEDAKDSVKVFKDIMGHLADWRDHLECMPLFVDVPMQGLFEFHTLAKHVYRVARDNGLGTANKTRLRNRNQRMMLRNVAVNKNDNPFNFRFNGRIWEELLYYAEQSGVKVKKYRTMDDIVVDKRREVSGQDKLGSTNVTVANRYRNPRKPKDDEGTAR